MPDPAVFADAIAAIQRLDARLSGLRPEIQAARNAVQHHQVRCAGVCQDINGATDLLNQLVAEQDGLLDDRLTIQGIRDLEITWIESGGQQELSL